LRKNQPVPQPAALCAIASNTGWTSVGELEMTAREHRERGSARGQMQKLSAGKFHSVPPRIWSVGATYQVARAASALLDSVAGTRASRKTCRPSAGYDGAITKFGLDLSITGGGIMICAVFTGTVAGPGFLAGDYVGASGEASLGAGLGPNALIGGSNRTVTLQPVSVSGQIGINIAVGVAALQLGLPRR
jgi:hypothetical protein